MFRLFVNTLTADDKYSRSIMQKLRQQFQTPLSQEQKTFFRFAIAFLKCEYPSLIISEIIDSERRGCLNV